MPPLPADLLTRPPEEAARLVALGYLEAAGAARARLDDAEDRAALHDFRVALRRLRSCLRAYRPYLAKAAGKKTRRRLRDIATATGPGRDAEVQLERLTAWRPGLTARRRLGCDWLIARVDERRRDASADVRRAAGVPFARAEQRLGKRLRAYVRMVPGYEGESHASFGEVAGALLRELAGELTGTLAGITGPDDEATCHVARIRTKRVRYLIEPMASMVEHAPATIARLKHLQELLGELHDLQLLAHEVSAGLEVAAAERARQLHDVALEPGSDEGAMRRAARRDERPGLLALARLVRDRRDEVFGTLQAEWLGANAQPFAAEVNELATRMAEQPAHFEVERKYLLHGAPEVIRSAAVLEIDQGWLPGRRLHERVRRSRGPDGERYYRTIKAGTGVQRLELEEEIGREVFDGLWPLTEGQRVHKRRYLLPDGALVWEIDEFLGRDLWLAEVELPKRDTVVEVPAWLADHVEREVTGEPEYLNINLAS